MAELKPCPFCGGEKISVREYDPFDGYQGALSVYRVWCRNCGAQIEQKKKAEASEAWNRRTENAAMGQKWISVEERLPEDDLPKDSDRRAIRCLVATGKGTVKVCTRQRFVIWKGGEQRLGDWEWSKAPVPKPTHWQPLPTPPAEVANG